MPVIGSPATGHAFSYGVDGLFRLSGGKITEMGNLADLFALQKQTGATPKLG